MGDGDPVDLPIESLKTLHKVGPRPGRWQRRDAHHDGGSGVPRRARPYLTKLLKSGKLPVPLKGNRHLVRAAAVERFKAERDRRLSQLDELAAAEEDLGVR